VIPRGVEIYFGTAPIDLRWGFDRLSGVITERIGRRPRSGAVFVFFGRRRTTIRVFFYDGTGLCLVSKRLDKGLFKLPLAWDGSSPTIALAEHELDQLFAGLDLELPTRH